MPKRADSSVCSATPETILWFNSYFNFQKDISFRFSILVYLTNFCTRPIQLRTSELTQL